MKKFVLICCTAFVCLPLVGCGGSDQAQTIEPASEDFVQKMKDSQEQYAKEMAEKAKAGKK